MKKIYLFIFLLTSGINLNAQQNRFKQEVFTNNQIIVDSNIVYGSALNFFPAVMVPLRMDVYHADTLADTLKNRPVIIIFHSGSFLPPNINAGAPSNGGAYFGSRRDSAVVEMCIRFARRGWVAIAATHRLGWIANSPSSNTQKITFMRAVYRATQDSRTLIRYMRRSVDSMGNKFKVDGNKIVVGGTSSGAYVVLHANSLDAPSDITVPILLDSIGNVIIDTTVMGGFYAGMYQGYSSRPNMVLSLGGALADTAMLSSADAPVVAFHGVLDPVTPMDKVGIIINPPPFRLHGSGIFMLAVNNRGINAKVKAAGGSGARAGFYAFAGAGFEPYGWYNKPPLFAPGNLRPRAMLYIDTIVNMFTNYAIGVLDLETNELSVKSIVSSGLNVYPNPVNGQLHISMSGDKLLKISILDVTGKLVYTESPDRDAVVVQTSGFVVGPYILVIETDQGTISRKLLLE